MTAGHAFQLDGELAKMWIKREKEVGRWRGCINLWKFFCLNPWLGLCRYFQLLLFMLLVNVLFSGAGRLAAKLFEHMRRVAAAVKIQKQLHCYFARKSYGRLQSSAVALQACIRAMIARNAFTFRKITKAAICIQAQWRCYSGHSYYMNLQKAALTFQCAWRKRLARRVIRTLKTAARETGALKEAKNKLEKQVEELSWRLQLEKRVRVTSTSIYHI
ncbi:hypothetical protein ZIOFF_047959 [Zingiber officinale]|uniref:Uncharacterized protein n=1 Tax=Zingiber officinale TaxID=94328 RepID=A0A8J5FYW0_ZINOF|nr:hypothetical protein ZIOFF_047959 [Zingiber officinale]